MVFTPFAFTSCCAQSLWWGAVWHRSGSENSDIFFCSSLRFFSLIFLALLWAYAQATDPSGASLLQHGPYLRVYTLRGASCSVEHFLPRVNLQLCPHSVPFSMPPPGSSLGWPHRPPTSPSFVSLASGGCCPFWNRFTRGAVCTSDGLMFWGAVSSCCQASLTNCWGVPAAPQGLQVVETVWASLGSWHDCPVCGNVRKTPRK